MLLVGSRCSSTENTSSTCQKGLAIGAGFPGGKPIGDDDDGEPQRTSIDGFSERLLESSGDW